MIKVNIITAENLPVPTKKERKTKILCLSTSSCNYFYGSFKNSENTRNPNWNCSFDVDLFRCCTLYFKLYSSQLLSKDIFLGEVNINFSKFFYESPGNDILKIPYECIKCEFPITSCSSPNAKLSLSFLFIPKSYRPIQFKDVSKPFIHLWATFTPTIQGIDNNIEIELLQTYAIQEKKTKSGYFFNLNNSHSWESVGYSSSNRTFLGPTGFTPIRTFFLKRINGLFNFFIVNVKNYSGVVTLNFIAEKKGKKEYLDDKYFISPKKEKNLIGTVKTVDIRVEPNKRYCAPFFLFTEKKLIKRVFEFCPFQQLTTHNFDSKSDYSDQICSEIPFQSSIIEVAQSEIEYLNDAHLMKTFVLPHSEKVSLAKIFSEFNQPYRPKIRIYINGSTTHSNGQSSYTHYWKPFFKIFDVNSGQLCSEISKQLKKKPFFHFRSLFEKDTLPFEWHTYVDLNLDEIGIDKIVIFNIKCMSTLESAKPPGIFHITSHVDDDNEREILLFRSPIYVDLHKSYCGIFMRFEFIEDAWNVVPMRYTFTKKKKLDVAIEALFRNNWVMPQFLDDKSDDISLPSSDDEILLDEVESTQK